MKNLITTFAVFLNATVSLAQTTNNTYIKKADNVTVNKKTTIVKKYKITKQYNVISKIDTKKNVSFSYDSFSGNYGIWVWPKEGRWDKPFVTYPMKFTPPRQVNLLQSQFTSMSARRNDEYNFGVGVLLYWKYDSLAALLQYGNNVCKSDNKMFIPIFVAKCFFIFGDDFDKKKMYYYEDGVVKSLYN